MSNANSYELAMLELINAEREAAGIEPLRLITTLNDAAEMHSAWMLDTDMFSHSGADGSAPSDRMADAGYPFEGNSMALENIGWQSLRGADGIEDDVAQVHASLMTSPGHRANILNPEAEDVGIGIETGTFAVQGGSYDAVMVTQVFGATDADISAWVDPGTVEAVDDPMLVEDDADNDETPVIDDEPIEEEPVAMDDPVDQDPTEGMDDEVDEDEMDDDDADETFEEDEGDDEEGDAPQVVDDDDMDGDDAMDDDHDVAMDDDDETDGPVCDIPEDGAPVLPFELSQFTVDLREAFEFSREGDQLIWETSEEKLIDVFLTAFEDWAMIPPEDMVGDEAADMADLMIEDTPEATIESGCEAEPEDWLFECGA